MPFALEIPLLKNYLPFELNNDLLRYMGRDSYPSIICYGRNLVTEHLSVALVR